MVLTQAVEWVGDSEGRAVSGTVGGIRSRYIGGDNPDGVDVGPANGFAEGASISDELGCKEGPLLGSQFLP
jgi:hypothetical protein